MHYDFVPMPQRKPLKWPGGARLALVFTINLEWWEVSREGDETFYAGGPSILPDPLPANVADWPNYTWREYGQRVGCWRLFDIFERAGVAPSCTMNAMMGVERRAVIDAVNERGWELVAHNYAQTDSLTNYAHEPDKERALIAKVLEVYEEVVGRPAKGWLSTSMRCTSNTPDILTENGLIFQADYLNDDQPYLVHTDNGELVCIPYTNELNDFATFFRRGMTVDQTVQVFKDQFDVLYREGQHTGMLMTIGLHPHVIGQPYRVRALEEFLAYVKRFDDVWFPKREEIAEWYLDNHQSHIG